MNKLNIHRKFLQLVFVITSDQMVDIIVAALTFDAFLSLNGENRDFQKKWGPKKSFWSPWGPKSPTGDQRGSSAFLATPPAQQPSGRGYIGEALGSTSGELFES